MATKIQKSEQEWREQLTREQFEVTRKAGTERAFTGPYWDEKAEGTYRCVCCGTELFRSGDADDLPPTELCDAHLGHVFDDGPAKQGGKRYCINGCALTLEKKE